VGVLEIAIGASSVVHRVSFSETVPYLYSATPLAVLGDTAPHHTRGPGPVVLRHLILERIWKNRGSRLKIQIERMKESNQLDRF